MKVVVGQGSCGVATGAKKTAAEFEKNERRNYTLNFYDKADWCQYRLKKGSNISKADQILADQVFRLEVQLGDQKVKEIVKKFNISNTFSELFDFKIAYDTILSIYSLVFRANETLDYYSFKEGNKDMRELLGGKGANLAEMTGIGLPVPRGFTVTTEACTKYYDDGKMISEEIVNQIYEKLAELEAISGKKMGDAQNPLLVSVRSGARASMPGMMDTVLNLGMNDEVAKGFAEVTQNPRFVYDSYRRFIQMFSDVVMGFPKSSFERLFDKIKEEKHVEFDTELTAEDLMEVV